MSSFIGPSNPIAWSQFHLKGGWKSVGGVTVGYGCIISISIFLTCWNHQNEWQSDLAGWTTALLVIQALAMLLMGTGRISGAVRQDLTSGAMESHRLMPISASSAIAGYVTGAPVHAIGIFVANLFIGAATTVMINMPVTRWLAANAVLAVFTIMIWVVTVFIAQVAKGAGWVVSIFAGLAFSARGGLDSIAPGLVLLAGPLVGASLVDVRARSTEMSGAMAMSLVAQAILTAIFFIGAARKYRRPSQLALSPRLAFALLFVWVGAGWAGMELHDELVGHPLREYEKIQGMIGTLLSAMALALVPLTNAARQYVSGMKRKVDDPQYRERTIGLVQAAGLATVILLIPITNLPERATHENVVITAAVIFAFCIGLVFLSAWAYKSAESVKMLVALWLIAIMAVPLIAAFIVMVGEKEAWGLAAFGPLGAILGIWGANTKSAVMPGVVTQCFYALVPVGLYWKRTSSGRAR